MRDAVSGPATTGRSVDEGVLARNAFARRLASLVALPDEDKLALLCATEHERAFDARMTLLKSGDAASAAIVVLDGFACCYKLRSNGQRQIVTYLLPGDLCDPDLFLLDRVDYALGTLTPCRIAQIPFNDLLDLTEARPRIAQALRVSKLIAEARLREWLVSLGCRTALERTAHLLCEVLMRLQAVGLATERSCELPITQNDLADTLGLSNVHMNRTIQALRADRLIELRGRRLVVRDVVRLQELAEFSTDEPRPRFAEDPFSHDTRRPA